MAKQVQVLTWCDACADDGEQTPGTTFQPNHGRRTVDLCDSHHAELLGRLELLLDAYGVSAEGLSKPRKATRKAHQAIQAAGAAMMAPGAEDGAQSFPCLFCGHMTATSSAMGSHLARMHGLGIAEAYGGSCPICGAQSTGTHIGRMHPEAAGQGMVGAVAWARAHGDPAGVVAAIELAAAQLAS